MFKKLSLAGAALAMGAAALVPAAADAQRYGGGYYDQGRYYGDQYRGGYDGYDRYNGDRRYYSYNNDRPCRRHDGTTGAVIGAIAGGLLGSAVAGRHDQGLGVLLGAGGGALAGRAVERSDRPDYCRR